MSFTTLCVLLIKLRLALQRHIVQDMFVEVVLVIFGAAFELFRLPLAHNYSLQLI